MKFTDTNVAGTIASTSKIACETASQKGYTTPDGIADASKKIAHFNPAIVGLTGGGSTKLDGITTVGVDVGMVQLVVIGDVADYYKLTAGVAIEGSPSIILPDDYNAGTNAKSWVLQSVGAEAVSTAIAAFDGTQAEAARDGMGITPSESGTPPLNATHAWTVIDPSGLNNAILFTAKVPGSTPLSIKYVISGASIVYSNIGTAWTITAPSGTTASALITDINAQESFPATALASGTVSGVIQATSGPADKPLLYGYDGTDGKLGDRIIYTGEASPMTFTCVAESPAFWAPLSGTAVRRYTSADANIAVGDGFDVLAYYESSPAGTLIVALPASLVVIPGQVFSIVSASDVATISFLSTATVLGSAVTSLLAGVIYSWVCITAKGKPVWLRI
jgi:hypothetical protein